jgi:hypothetical protein
MLRNHPLDWRTAIARNPGRTTTGTRLDLSPISKAILAWMDANPRPITAGEMVIGLDSHKRWSQTRGDMHRRLVSLARTGRVIALAGGLFARGKDPAPRPSLLSSAESQ